MKAFQHQIIGTNLIVKEPAFALLDEMGLGKTKQIIDAGQILFSQKVIDKVLVISPAAVRSVWFDSDLGELAKHLHTSCTVIEFHDQIRRWGKDGLKWVITNYEYVRINAHLEVLLKFCDKKTMLVIDESSAIKSHKTLQTKACIKIRRMCGRVVLLNGTPITLNPGDMFSQCYVMDPKILDCETYYHFRSRYAIMGGWRYKQIVQWRNLDEMQRRIKPYAIRRLKSECLDLPPKLDSIVFTVPLSLKTWNIYKEMKNEMIAWLDEQTVSVARQAVVKVMRLAQITCGFLGGLEEGTREIGQEKLQFFMKWLNEQLELDPNLKLLVWCRFRAELSRLRDMSVFANHGIKLGTIRGGQKVSERAEAVRLLDPRTVPDGPVVVIGSPQAGGLGLNLTAAHTVFYMSNDHSLKSRLQSADRVHRPGQTYPVSYFDLEATGPKGEKTVDHLILKALQKKEELAQWTIQAWVRALEEE